MQVLYIFKVYYIFHKKLKIVILLIQKKNKIVEKFIEIKYNNYEIYFVYLCFYSSVGRATDS